jgi:hypothetical protein
MIDYRLVSISIFVPASAFFLMNFLFVFSCRDIKEVAMERESDNKIRQHILPGKFEIHKDTLQGTFLFLQKNSFLRPDN